MYTYGILVLINTRTAENKMLSVGAYSRKSQYLISKPQIGPKKVAHTCWLTVSNAYFVYRNGSFAIASSLVIDAVFANISR